MSNIQPGDTVDSPYELTTSDAVLDVWHGCFHSTGRLVTSTPFAQRMGFEARLLPFDLVLFLAQGMAHAGKATHEVSYSNARHRSRRGRSLRRIAAGRGRGRGSIRGADGRGRESIRGAENRGRDADLPWRRRRGSIRGAQTRRRRGRDADL